MTIDLQEATIRDDAYAALNKLIEGLHDVPVHPRLVWLYVWDIVKDKLDYYHAESGEDYVRSITLSEKDVFDLFWEDADKNGFSLEYGTEDLDEAVFDWMLERNIIVALEDDSWLDEAVDSNV
jgi:hypothetical protein